jgi:hypothetical protein
MTTEAPEGGAIVPEGYDDVVSNFKTLWQGGTVEIESPESGQTFAFTKLVTPDFYDKYVRGKERYLGFGAGKSAYDAMLPDVAPGQSNIAPGVRIGGPDLFSPVTPLSQNDYLTITDAVDQHWDLLMESSPDVVGRMMTNPYLLLPDAEIAGSFANEFFDTFNLATQVADVLFGDSVSPVSFEQIEDTLRFGTATDFFFSQIGDFSQRELDEISLQYSYVNLSQRENLSAQSVLFWRGKDMKNPVHRVEYISWLRNEAALAHEDAVFMQTEWGRFFDWGVDQYLGTNLFKDFFRRRVNPSVTAARANREGDDRGFFSRFWDYFQQSGQFTYGVRPGQGSQNDAYYSLENYQYSGHIPNPESWAIISNLTWGQQVAAQLGYSPDDAEWDWFSGGVDGLTEIVSPVEVVGMFLNGYARIGKAIPRIGEISKLGRARLAARTAIPVFGRRIPEANPKLPRGIARRVGWALGSRTKDEILDIMDERGVFDNMMDIMRTGGPAALGETYKSMKNIMETNVATRFLDAATNNEKETFKTLYSWGLEGYFAKSPETALIPAETKLRELQEAHDQMLRGHIEAQRISVTDLTDEHNPLHVFMKEENPMVFRQTPEGLRRMTKAELAGHTGDVMVLNGKINIATPQGVLDDVAEKLSAQTDMDVIVDADGFLRAAPKPTFLSDIQETGALADDIAPGASPEDIAYRLFANRDLGALDPSDAQIVLRNIFQDSLPEYLDYGNFVRATISGAGSPQHLRLDLSSIVSGADTFGGGILRGIFKVKDETLEMLVPGHANYDRMTQLVRAGLKNMKDGTPIPPSDIGLSASEARRVAAGISFLSAIEDVMFGGLAASEHPVNISRAAEKFLEQLDDIWRRKSVRVADLLYVGAPSDEVLEAMRLEEYRMVPVVSWQALKQQSSGGTMLATEMENFNKVVPNIGFVVIGQASDGKFKLLPQARESMHLYNEFFRGADFDTIEEATAFVQRLAADLSTLEWRVLTGAEHGDTMRSVVPHWVGAFMEEHGVRHGSEAERDIISLASGLANEDGTYAKQAIYTRMFEFGGALISELFPGPGQGKAFDELIGFHHTYTTTSHLADTLINEMPAGTKQKLDSFFAAARDLMDADPELQDAANAARIAARWSTVHATARNIIDSLGDLAAAGRDPLNRTFDDLISSVDYRDRGLALALQKMIDEVRPDWDPPGAATVEHVVDIAWAMARGFNDVTPAEIRGLLDGGAAWLKNSRNSTDVLLDWARLYNANGNPPSPMKVDWRDHYTNSDIFQGVSNRNEINRDHWMFTRLFAGEAASTVANRMIIAAQQGMSSSNPVVKSASVDFNDGLETFVDFIFANRGDDSARGFSYELFHHNLEWWDGGSTQGKPILGDRQRALNSLIHGRLMDDPEYLDKFIEIQQDEIKNTLIRNINSKVKGARLIIADYLSLAAKNRGEDDIAVYNALKTRNWDTWDELRQDQWFLQMSQMEQDNLMTLLEGYDYNAVLDTFFHLRGVLNADGTPHVPSIAEFMNHGWGDLIVHPEGIKKAGQALKEVSDFSMGLRGYEDDQYVLVFRGDQNNMGGVSAAHQTSRHPTWSRKNSIVSATFYPQQDQAQTWGAPKPFVVRKQDVIFDTESVRIGGAGPSAKTYNEIVANLTGGSQNRLMRAENESVFVGRGRDFYGEDIGEVLVEEETLIPLADFIKGGDASVSRYNAMLSLQGRNLDEALYADDLDLVKRMLPETDFDAVRYVSQDGNEIISGRNVDALADKHWIGESDPDALQDLNKLKGDIALQEREIDLLREAGSPHKMIITDIEPTVRTAPMFRPWASLGSRKWANGYIKAIQRTMPRIFNTALPQNIDAGTGAGDLQRALRALGASRNTIQDFVKEFLSTDIYDRPDVVYRALVQAGKDSGNAVLEHGIWSWRQNVRNLSTSKTVDATTGRAMDRGSIINDLGETEVIGFLPTHGVSKIPLPDESLFQMAGRYYSSGVLPKRLRNSVLPGFLPKTRQNRKKIIELVQQQFPDMDPDEALRLAYSSVLGTQGDAAGAVWKAYNSAVRPAWMAAHKAFKTIVLAGNAIAWMVKVVLFEEQVRGALTGMPSFFRNPAGMIAAMYNETLVAFRPRLYRSNARWLSRKVDELTQGAADVGEIGARTRDILPGLDLSDASNVSEARLIVTRELTNMLKGDRPRKEYARAFNIGEMYRRGMFNAERRAAKTLEKHGMDPDFSWEQVEDIAGRSIYSEWGEDLATEMQSANSTITISSRASQTERVSYAQSLAKEVDRIIYRDPITRKYGLHWMAARARGTTIPAGYGAAAMLGDTEYLKVERNAHRILSEPRHLGAERVEQLAKTTEGRAKLAEEYMNRLIIPYMEDHLGFMWADLSGSVASYSKTRKMEVLNNLASERPIEVTIGEKSYTFLHNDVMKNVSTMRQMVNENALNTALMDSALPHSVWSPFLTRWDRAMLHPWKQAAEWGRRNPLSALGGWLIRTFGERATMKFNRRPGWMFHHRQVFDDMKRLGLPDEVARRIAEGRASEIVNYSYFNTQHVTPWVRKLSDVIPFFNAQVEVLVSWFGRLPFADPNYRIMGPTVMARKIGNAFEALESTGLMQADIEYETDRNGNQREVWRYKMVLHPDAVNGQSELGQELSKWGYQVQTAPLNMLRIMQRVYNVLAEDDIPLEFTDPSTVYAGKGIEVDVGMPIDPTSPHGVMAVNQLLITPSPAVKSAAMQIVNNVHFLSNHKTVKTSGQTAGDLAAEYDTTVYELIDMNRKTLEWHYGSENVDSAYESGLYAAGYPREDAIWEIGKRYVDNIMTGDNRDNLVLPEGVTISIPGTAFSDWVKPALYPFGMPSNELRFWEEMLPSTWQYFMRGWGLYSGVSDPNNFWNYDPETGELTASEGIIDTFMLPSAYDRASAASNIHLAFRQLEYEAWARKKETGEPTYLERLTQIQNRIYELETLADLSGIGSSRVDIGFGSAAEPINMSPAEREYAQLVTEFQQVQQEFMSKAYQRAGSMMIARGLMGATSPVTPRMIDEEQQIVRAYWQSRDAVEYADQVNGRLGAGLTALPADFELIHQDDFGEFFNTMYTAWLGEGNGDEARSHLKSAFPELWAYAFGSYYWGPSGEPAVPGDTDELFRQIEEGLKDPFPPGVFIQRIMRSGFNMSKEAELVERFGNNDVKAAIAILNDWNTYEGITEKSSLDYASMDYIDEQFFGGQYADWRDRNAEDKFNLDENRRERLNNYLRVIEEVEGMIPTMTDFENLTFEERQNMTTQLKILSQGVRGIWESEGGEFTNAQNGREQVLSWYFSNVVGGYYEEVADAWELINSAQSDYDRDKAFDRLRDVHNLHYARRTQHPSGEIFPSVHEWTWNRLSNEEKKEKVDASLAKPAFWYSMPEILHILEVYPEAASILPTSLDEYKLFEGYGEIRNELSYLNDPVHGLGIGSTGDGNKAKSALEAEYSAKFAAMKKADIGNVFDYTPMQKLYAMDAFTSPLLQQMAAEFNKLFDAIDANPDLGRSSGYVQESVYNPRWQYYKQQILNDDVALDEFLYYGDVVTGKIVLDEIFDKLVLDNF